MFDSEIIEFCDELERLHKCKEKFNKIVHLIHNTGLLSTKTLQIYILDGTMYSIHYFDGTKISFMLNYSTTDGLRTGIDFSRLKYNPNSTEINLFGTVIKNESFTQDSDSMLFQYSTLYDDRIINYLKILNELFKRDCSTEFCMNFASNLDYIIELKKFISDFESYTDVLYENVGVEIE